MWKRVAFVAVALAFLAVAGLRHQPVPNAPHQGGIGTSRLGELPAPAPDTPSLAAVAPTVVVPVQAHLADRSGLTPGRVPADVEPRLRRPDVRDRIARPRVVPLRI